MVQEWMYPLVHERMSAQHTRFASAASRTPSNQPAANRATSSSHALPVAGVPPDLDLMMASGAGTAGAACSRSSRSSSYVAAAAHQLTVHAGRPGGDAGGHEWPRSLGDGSGGGDGELRGRAPAARAAAGGVAVARAVWAWIGRGRRKVAVPGRSGSSATKNRYGGHEEYAQNFDEGAAAREPENLTRSFSARYARQVPWSDGAP